MKPNYFEDLTKGVHDLLMSNEHKVSKLPGNESATANKLSAHVGSALNWIPRT
jgi:hypothetical protein